MFSIVFIRGNLINVFNHCLFCFTFSYSLSLILHSTVLHFYCFIYIYKYALDGNVWPLCSHFVFSNVSRITRHYKTQHSSSSTCKKKQSFFAFHCPWLAVLNAQTSSGWNIPYRGRSHKTNFCIWLGWFLWKPVSATKNKKIIAALYLRILTKKLANRFYIWLFFSQLWVIKSQL